MSAWVDVEERMPEPGTPVLVYKDSAYYVGVYWSGNSKGEFWLIDETENYDTYPLTIEITVRVFADWWMPLPAPPGEEGGG